MVEPSAGGVLVVGDSPFAPTVSVESSWRGNDKHKENNDSANTT